MKTIFTILFLSISFCVFSQSYESAVGARFGFPLSISYKKFISENTALEAYGGFTNNFGFNRISLSGAYLKHSPLEIESIENLTWYWGAGASIYFWSFDTGFSNESSTSFSADGYVGVEYTFTDTPLSLSVDWVPRIFISGFGSGFAGGFGALSARYVLDRG